MRSAVIVSTARTPIGRAYRGAFNTMPAPTLASHAIKVAVARAGIDVAEVEDVILGAALQQAVRQPTSRATRSCGPACRLRSQACRSTVSARRA
jgi:acetyl-CoA C-acetyltransferase